MLGRRLALTLAKRSYLTCFSTSAAANSDKLAEFSYDKKLFTPGPLQVSASTKNAMCFDIGSRDPEFVKVISQVRSGMIDLAGADPERYTCVPMQGSGTFCVEAVVQSTIPRHDGHIVILANGVYGKRMETICNAVGVRCTTYMFPDTEKIPLAAVEDVLKSHKNLTNVSTLHCETSSGVVNDVESIGHLVRQHAPNATYIVDAMSSFGAIPLNLADCNIDFLVTSPNKCIEGVPGFGLALADKEKLLNCRGNSKSISLDLVAQYEGLEANGQFRFTPPTHTFLALRQALIELKQEGGSEGRAFRYSANRDVVCNGMKRMGFQLYLEGDHPDSYIITPFKLPTHPNFKFDELYNRLQAKGLCIYHNQVCDTEIFRIGHIGQIFPSDCELLVRSIEEACHEMGVPIPVE